MTLDEGLRPQEVAALAVALSQLRRGVEVTPNLAATCVLGLGRLAGRVEYNAETVTYSIPENLVASADGAPAKVCCASHNRNCEPPSELCCGNCTEARHDFIGFRTGTHEDGTACTARDLACLSWACPAAKDATRDCPDDCESCGSGKWELMCEECRYYAAQDAEVLP